jgi:DNA modification methylase
MNRQLINGDCLEELKKLDDNSVDLLCTDPPYGYGFMGKHWDTFKEKDSTKSQQVGWMSPGMKKDTYGMKEFFDPIWKECLRVLKPGALAFVMSAPRSDVQTIMSQTLRDAGFDISFTPIYWTYASGFPKAMNIGKMIDKRDGNKREVIGIDKNSAPDLRDVGKKSKEAIGIDKLSYGQVENAERKEMEITKGSSELEGSYGGFQPKPAVEVVIVAMKPIEEKGLLAQAEKNGKAVSWFDDCRIPFDEDDTPQGGYGAMDIGIGKPGETQEYRSKDYEDYVKKQKSFANAKTIGTTIKGKEHFLGGDIKQLNPATNYQKKDGNETRGWNNSSGYGRDSEPKTTKRKPREDGTVFKTSGFKSENNDTAEASPFGRFPANMLVSDEVLDDYSRFFSLDSWFEKNLESLPEPVQQTFPFMIVPKASKSEKNDGLDNFDTKQTTGGGGGVGDYVDDVNSASGKFGSEKAPSRNIHPTVKPLTLMNYLVVLGSRKGDVVLEPFAGSGTTALACVSQERDYIAIEREEEYYEIAKARLTLVVARVVKK